MSQLPFHANGQTVTVSATTDGSTIYAIAVDGSKPQLRITNCSSECAFVTLGSSTVAAVWPTTAADVTGYPIGPNATEIITPGKVSYAAAVYESTSNTLFMVAGTGGT